MLGMKMTTAAVGVGGLRSQRWRWLSRECHFSADDGGKWLTLPPVSATVKTTSENQLSSSASTSALKWVIRCCPNIPKTLVHKLFRLKQVRMLPAASVQDHHHHHRFKKVAAKDTLNSGDRIFLPHSVKETPAAPKHECHVTAKEINFIHSLVIYKDPATLVLNKPPGMPVQVVVDNGKSDRITTVDHSTLLSSHHAITEYRVIASSSNGYTWLELSPLTGRKHQLRVHCAEVLGTPIVGDYKYGWQAHKKWGHYDLSNLDDSSEEELVKEETLPFGLNLTKGSISEKQPRLHLHCKQIVLPNISQALKNVQSASNCDLSVVETLDLKVDLPPYMQTSWDVTNS